MGQITRTNFGITKRVTLTNAQILTLFTAPPITLVPARAGTIWLPLFLGIMSNTVAAAYATVATFQLGVTGALTLWGTITLADSQLDSGAASFAFTGTNVIGGTVTGGTQVSASGLPLVISANADPTGGDPANTCELEIMYVEMPV